MRVQILHVPDCPGAVTLSAYLTQLAVDNADVERQVVSDLDQATALGMTGSPTLLIDGADPFAVAGLPPSLSCRLYRDENGSIARAPSLAQLRATLAGTERLATFDPATLDPAWAAAGTAARHAALPGNLRRLHQAILAYFVENGEPPGRSWLGPEARRLGLDRTPRTPTWPPRTSCTWEKPARSRWPTRSPASPPGTGCTWPAALRCGPCARSTRSASRR